MKTYKSICDQKSYRVVMIAYASTFSFAAPFLSAAENYIAAGLSLALAISFIALHVSNEEFDKAMVENWKTLDLTQKLIDQMKKDQALMQSVLDTAKQAIRKHTP